MLNLWRRRARGPKVFGIGFHKTGTTSLARALEILGYRVCGPLGVHDPDIATRAPELVREAARRHDAFQDNPFPVLFREIDAWYPGSRFVLTTRPEEAWLRSVLRHFGEGVTPMRTWIYGVGSPVGHESVYLERYRRHHEDVRTHFADRTEQLLEMDITAGEGWERLCPFLGIARPRAAFPKLNVGAQRTPSR